MIWLSPMIGTEEGSVYFEIRDIVFQQTGNEREGLIRGLLGDGQCEVCTEVQLGKNPQVRIIPVWTDAGEVETLSVAVDEELLKEQLLEAVQRLFAIVGGRSFTNLTADKSRVYKSVLKENHWLAA